MRAHCTVQRSTSPSFHAKGAAGAERGRCRHHKEGVPIRGQRGAPRSQHLPTAAGAQREEVGRKTGRVAALCPAVTTRVTPARTRLRGFLQRQAARSAALPPARPFVGQLGTERRGHSRGEAMPGAAPCPRSSLGPRLQPDPPEGTGRCWKERSAAPGPRCRNVGGRGVTRHRALRRCAGHAWDRAGGSAFSPPLFLIALSQKGPETRLQPAALKLVPVRRQCWCCSGLLFLAGLRARLGAGSGAEHLVPRPRGRGGAEAVAVLRPPRCFLSGAFWVPFISALHAVRKGRPKAEDGSGGHRRRARTRRNGGWS